MTEIIFAKTRHVYDSYMDFWKLVELSGFPIIYVDEIRIDNPGVYITAPMNGDYRVHIANELNRIVSSKAMTQAHLILWNLERPSGSAGSVGEYANSNQELMYERLVDEVWVSDIWLAKETELRYVVLGGDYGLGEIEDGKVYDFCHMSAEIPRRQSIYKYFSNVGHNCWPPERDKVLKKSRFGLNIHQDNHPFVEPLRLVLFAAYGLPIISETCKDIYPYGDVITTINYSSMVKTIKNMLRADYSPYKRMGLNARHRMCKQFQFGTMVKEAVSQSVGTWR